MKVDVAVGVAVAVGVGVDVDVAVGVCVGDGVGVGIPTTSFNSGPIKLPLSDWICQTFSNGAWMMISLRAKTGALVLISITASKKP